MANGPIRTLYKGRQLAFNGVPSTWSNMYFEGDLAHVPHVGITIPDIRNGTVMPDSFLMRAGRWSELRPVRVPLLFSQAGEWLSDVLSPSTNTLMFTGANAHVFRAGPATPQLPTAFRVYDNVEWEELLNQQCATCRITLAGGNTAPMMELDYGGSFGVPTAYTVTLGSPSAGTFTLTVGGQTTTGIAFNALASAVQTALQLLSTVGTGGATVTGVAGGPYTVTFSRILYNQVLTGSGAGLTGGAFSITNTPAAVAVPAPIGHEPMDYPMQTVNVNGVQGGVISGSLNIRNAYAPYWDGTNGVDITRMKRAMMGVDIDCVFDYLQRAGSLYDNALSGTVPGAFQVLWQDTTNVLATQTTLGGGVTLNGAITVPGYQTATLAGTVTMIKPGSRLLVDSATAPEVVTVYSVSGQVITTVFNKAHLTSAPVVEASPNIYPILQLDVYRPLLLDPNKANDQSERAIHITGRAGYNTTAATVMSAILIDGNTSFPGS